MARAIAECTCMVCGKKFEKINRNCYNRKAADDWKEWAERNCTTCPECYHEEVEEKKKTDPFNLEFFVEIRNKKVTSGYKVVSNNSFQRKGELKEYGFEFYNSSWEFVFSPNTFDEMIEKAQEELEKLIKVFPGSKANSWITEKEARGIFEKADQIGQALEELGPKPCYPEKFSCIIAGKRWNKKIYGGKQKSIYIDGKKIDISAELAKEVEETQNAIRSWNEKKEKILGGSND